MLATLAPVLSGVGVAPATNSYFSIASQTVGVVPASSITFTSIPSTYTHLQIRYIAAGITGNNIYMAANGDTNTSNYHAHLLAGTGSSAVGVNLGNTAGFQVGFNGLGSGSYFYAGVIDLLDYGSTVKNKTVKVLGGADANGSGEMDFISGVWMNSGSAVTSLVLSASSSFVQYSSFALYGVK
jgi:hypothetical protein